jgi:hypothetical protein
MIGFINTFCYNLFFRVMKSKQSLSSASTADCLNYLLINDAVIKSIYIGVERYDVMNDDSKRMWKKSDLGLNLAFLWSV